MATKSITNKLVIESKNSVEKLLTFLESKPKTINTNKKYKNIKLDKRRRKNILDNF